MRRIYIDSLHHCHIDDDGTRTPVETDFFDGKCEVYVEGYACEAKENGIALYPWKPYSELYAIQRQYEKQLLTEYAEALKKLGVQV